MEASIHNTLEFCYWGEEWDGVIARGGGMREIFLFYMQRAKFREMVSHGGSDSWPGSAGSGFQVSGPQHSPLPPLQLLPLSCGHYEGAWIPALKVVHLLLWQFQDLGAGGTSAASWLDWSSLSFLSSLSLFVSLIVTQNQLQTCAWLFSLVKGRPSSRMSASGGAAYAVNLRPTLPSL